MRNTSGLTSDVRQQKNTQGGGRSEQAFTQTDLPLPFRAASLTPSFCVQNYKSLAQEGRGTRRLEGSPELLLGRTRQPVRERELDLRVLLRAEHGGGR